MKKFNLGEVVRLNSGGPEMTVDSINGSGSLHCIWFVNDQLLRDNFEPESLISEADFKKQIEEKHPFLKKKSDFL